MLPVLLDLTGRLVVVVGGGGVGRRKARAARAAGAPVRLVALQARPPGEDDPGLQWRQEPYAEACLAGAALVFAAATPAVNALVAADARRLGVWVNSASDPAAGDFLTPAVVRRGRLVVAVSTTGASPAAARHIRERLEAEFDEAYTGWLDLLAEVRAAVLASPADADTRRALLEEAARGPWLERVRDAGVEPARQGVRAWLAGRGIPGTL
jgi:precorrin-2 dehydrogenase/sirohydrochlorin ferrochelatase